MSVVSVSYRKLTAILSSQFEARPSRGEGATQCSLRQGPGREMEGDTKVQYPDCLEYQFIRSEMGCEIPVSTP